MSIRNQRTGGIMTTDEAVINLSKLMNDFQDWQFGVTGRLQHHKHCKNCQAMIPLEETNRELCLRCEENPNWLTNGGIEKIRKSMLR